MAGTGRTHYVKYYTTPLKIKPPQTDSASILYGKPGGSVCYRRSVTQCRPNSCGKNSSSKAGSTLDPCSTFTRTAEVAKNTKPLRCPDQI